MILFTYRVKKDIKRFSNAVLLIISLNLIYKGIVETIYMYYPPLNTDYELTFSGDVIGLFFNIFLIGIILLGIYLIINGTHLLSKEKLSIAHTLPIILGIFCISFPIVSLFGEDIILYINNKIARNLILLLFKICYYGALYLPLSLIGYILYSYIYYVNVKYIKKKKTINYIIVLGARLCGEEVSPLLAKRLDKGIEIYKNHFNENIKFIVSGGKGNDEIVSEAYAMKKYLISKNIPEFKIIEEDKSKSTYENLAFSKTIIENYFGPYSYGLFVSNNFHILRAAMITSAINLNSDGIGCKTAKYYLPAASIRETIAFILKYKRTLYIYFVITTIYSFIGIYF